MAPPFTAGDRLAQSSHPEPPRDARVPAPRPARNGRRGRTRSLWLGRITGLTLAVGTLTLLVGGIGAYTLYQHYCSDLPDVQGLRAYQPPVMSRVYAGDSRLLEELATERRIFVPYAAIPHLVKMAFVAAEDQNFFSHNGVDPVATLRALVTDALNYGRGKRPQGASTITQQVVKNMLLGNEVSIARKVREAVLAMRVEHSLTKDRILELYLNEIYLGEGAYGVAAAAQTYFDKALDQLTPAEAAFLAALPKAPNNYNPQRFQEAARARRDWVLDRMVDSHVITAAQAAEGKTQAIVQAPFRRPDVVSGADYFAEDVRRELIDRFGPDRALQGGLVVQTSLDPALQAHVDRALRAGLVKYDQSHGGWRGPVTRLAADAALATDWPAALAAVARPPGMPPEWKLGVVIDTTASQARVGVLDRAGAAATGSAATPPRVLPMFLSDLGWARPAHDGTLGPAPRRMADVARVGDVVMVEPTHDNVVINGTVLKALSGGAERLLLRQIPAVQGAAVTMDPATGRVLAMSGGWSYEMSQFNRASQAMRQPGSSFKPVVYLTGMEQGISPSQIFMDAPFVQDNGAAGQWRPQNYENDFSGPVPLHLALEKSLNLVTVRLAKQVGMDAVATNAIAFHVVDSMPRVLPAALGAVDTTVLRQAAFYSALDDGGREVVPTLIDTVQDRDGHVIWRAPALACSGCDDPAQPPSLTDQRRSLADPPSVFQVLMMMQGVVEHGTGMPAAVGLNRQIAGKTGTTQDFNDAWFVGFTPDLVTAVWVGFDTPSSLGKGETGGALAAPIWRDIMAYALKDRPALKFVPPPGVTVASWDDGAGTAVDAFKPGQTPGASSSDVTASADPAGDGGAGAAAAGGTGGTAAGVDSGLGGLY